MAEFTDDWSEVPVDKLRETLDILTRRYNATYTDEVRKQIRDELARRGEGETE